MVTLHYALAEDIFEVDLSDKNDVVKSVIEEVMTSMTDDEEEVNAKDDAEAEEHNVEDDAEEEEEEDTAGDDADDADKDSDE